MKYLFIDTCNYMACAFLAVVDHTPQTIDYLIDLLNGNLAKLILPEVVEQEFFREVELELLKKKKSIKNIKNQLDNIFPSHLMPGRAQFIKSLDQAYSRISASSRVVRTNIKSLFSLNNVMRIPLSHDIFIKAYSRVLARQKPSNSAYCAECGEIKHRLDDDCMIFESILSLKDQLENNELIFCSANTKHFASQNKKQNCDFLHPDLIASFSQQTTIRYYTKLTDALKIEFDRTVSTQEKQQISEYFQWRDLVAKQFGTSWGDVARTLAAQSLLKIDMPTINEIVKAQLSFQEDFKKAIQDLYRIKK